MPYFTPLRIFSTMSGIKARILTPQPQRILGKATAFACKCIPSPEYAELVNISQLGISLLKRATWAHLS